MDIIITIFTIIDAMVALLLIAVVLVQQSKDGGFGGAPFGGAGDSVFGAHAADHLTKITVGLAAIFLCLTLTLAIVTGRRPDDDGNLPQDKDGNTEMSELVNEKKEDVKEEDKKIINELEGVNSVAPEKETTEKKIVIPKPDKNKPVKVKLGAPDKIKKLINKKKSDLKKADSEKSVAPKAPVAPNK
jgi:protein translocase SecG subunit